MELIVCICVHALCVTVCAFGYTCILRGKCLAIYFEDSQFRRNRSLSLKVSNIYVDKRSRLR